MMPNAKQRVFIVMLFSLISLLAPLVNADTYNETVSALNQSRTDLQEMTNAGFTVLRIRDILTETEQLFEAQSALLGAGGTPDFSLILQRTQQIATLRKQAVEMNDELEALNISLREVNSESEAHALFSKAQQEFIDERYDHVSELVGEAYAKISEEQAVQTRVRAVYEASTKTIFDFLKNIWQEAAAIFIFVGTTYLVFRKKIAIFFINRKIKNLHFEKEVLGKLIKKAQYEYFHLFKISEELYHIRIEKFGELIRDLDRQIPGLLEEKEQLRRGRNTEEESTQAKKSHKNISIITVLSCGLLAGGMFVLNATGTLPFSEITAFVQPSLLAGIQHFHSIINTTEPLLLISGSVTLLFILLAGIMFLRKRKNKAKQKQHTEKQSETPQQESPEPKPSENQWTKMLSSVYAFFPAKLHKIYSFPGQTIKKIKDARHYRKLLHEKSEEEKRRNTYLRKQKVFLFKRKFSQTIHTLFLKLHFTKKGTEATREKTKKNYTVRKWLMGGFVVVCIAVILFTLFYFNILPYATIRGYIDPLIAYLNAIFNTVSEVFT